MQGTRFLTQAVACQPHGTATICNASIPSIASRGSAR